MSEIGFERRVLESLQAIGAAIEVLTEATRALNWRVTRLERQQVTDTTQFDALKEADAALAAAIADQDDTIDSVVSLVADLRAKANSNQDLTGVISDLETEAANLQGHTDKLRGVTELVSSAAASTPPTASGEAAPAMPAGTSSPEGASGAGEAGGPEAPAGEAGSEQQPF